MKSLFGTDGVRGIANLDLTAELAFKLGQAVAFVLGKNVNRPKFIIGKDTRISGYMLEDAISSGILSVGGDVIKVGVIPTPAVAYLVKEMKADVGVVISASHNSFEYNGIKFFDSQGYKLNDDIEKDIERIVEGNYPPSKDIMGGDLGVLRKEKNLHEAYVKHIVDAIDEDFAGLKIAIDCANGASYKVAKEVFDKSNAEVFYMGDSPNGININDGLGSTHPEKLCQLVKDKKCHIGLAFDGDADRLIAVDEKGQILDGDRILYICARYLKGKDELDNDLVTATVMSNMGLDDALKEEACKIQKSGVGDRYVLEMMRETGSVLGGEQSGHIIMLNHTTTGDGLLTAVVLISAIVNAGRTPSDLAALIKPYPQVLYNVKVKNKNKEKYLEYKEIEDKIHEIEEKMQSTGRVLIRASGTEPLVRIMIEGKDIEEINLYASSLSSLMSDLLN